MTSVRVEDSTRDYAVRRTGVPARRVVSWSVDPGELVTVARPSGSGKPETKRRDGTTFIFSTHDPRVMARAPRVVRLADGRIAA